jgi:hypothetical protein
MGICERNRSPYNLTYYYADVIVEAMVWDVEYTNEFGDWWDSLSDKEQNDTVAVINLLAERGANLLFPYSSGIVGSKNSQMRELRVQSGGRPLRIFYAFDPRRTAILLIGGDKTGDNRFMRSIFRLRTGFMTFI